jgi:hypothetical protein
MDMYWKSNRVYLRAAQLGLSLLAAALLLSSGNRGQAAPAGAGFGYGFNVAAWDVGLLQSMGFNWMKVFSPPGSRLPVNILLRVAASAADLGNLTAFGNDLYELAQDQADYVEAYEIGNEPNLDADYGWGTAPNAADYAALLCVAYDRIKDADADAIVVSAGLAPTGRVQGNWNGHPGHNGLYQDEREYFKEFLNAGGGACLDAVGYHNYGFSADYDAEPDVAAGDPAQNCANGFCFRGAEKLYEIMQANGLGNKKMWTTEYGWIVAPPDDCLDDPGWQGRQWQIVSEQKQAENLVGSFQYATANWPWMEAMFVFNLNFNKAAYPVCEQMRFYGVEDRPAEDALRNMPKVTPPATGQLEVSPQAVTLAITDNDQPFAQTIPVRVSNTGTESFTYTVTADASADLVPAINDGTGSLEAGEQGEFQIVIESQGRSIGAYTGLLTITATPEAVGAPALIPLTLYVFAEVHNNFLPLIIR